MANFMYESGAFEDATPEFIVESMPDAALERYLFQLSMESEKRLLSGDRYQLCERKECLCFSHISTILSLRLSITVFNNHDDLHLYNVSYNAHTGGIPEEGYTEITAQRLPVLSEPRLIMAKALQALHPSENHAHQYLLY